MKVFRYSQLGKIPIVLKKDQNQEPLSKVTFNKFVTISQQPGINRKK
jgi:hypothetical protein